MNQLSAVPPGILPDSVHRELSLPAFEQSADAIRESIRELLDNSRKLLDQIGTQDLKSVRFESTLGALEELEAKESEVTARIFLLQNVHPRIEIREAARDALLEFEEQAIDMEYDPKVYAAVKAYSEKQESLEAEDKKLLEDTMRDYRRMGMELPEKQREEIKSLLKRLSQLETDFVTHIQEHQAALYVSPERLKGLEQSFIEQLQKNEQGERRISLDYPEYLPVMEFCEDENLRKELQTLKQNTAHEKNAPILNEMVNLRHEIATKLGYSSYNHYVLEEQMAKSPQRVFEFLRSLEDRLQKKAQDEKQKLTELKREWSGQANAKLQMWDYSFLNSLWKRKQFDVDTKALKDFFPLEHLLSSMFALYQDLFGLTFEQQNSGFYRWHEEVQLYKVKDEQGEALGYFYLDLHPREGKYNHAAAFGLCDGRLRADGRYQAPVSAMVCNFPRSHGNQPALIPHREAETLFHEFGHILHGVLSKAKYSSYAGTNVAQDFVEAPSQVLENWVWNYESLKHIAKHYKDPQKEISKEFVERMNQAEKAGSALFYLRQLSFAKADLEMHKAKPEKDVIELSNDVIRDTFMEPPPDTAFAAGWGHMVGYASGYYGYLWADVMAADMFSIFKKNGILNKEVGRRLRKEIYEVGSSRDENQSLEGFLGRPLSQEAFFEELGTPADS